MSVQDTLDWSIFDSLWHPKEDITKHHDCKGDCTGCGAKISSFQEDIITNDVVCISCGLVQRQLVDSSCESINSYHNGEQQFSAKNIRGDKNNDNELFSNQTNLSTNIQARSWKQKGNNIIRYHNFSKMTPKDYNLWLNYSQIEQLGAQLNISNSIILAAKFIYKDTHLYKIKRGNVKKGYIAACIFVSCKINNCNCISQSKLSELINVDRKFITQNIKFIEKNIWNLESYKNIIVHHEDHFQDYIFFIVGIIENPTPQYLPKSIIDNWNINQPLMNIRPFSHSNTNLSSQIQKLTKFISTSVEKLNINDIHIQPHLVVASLIFIYICEYENTISTLPNYKQYLKKILAYGIKTSIACLHNKIYLCKSVLNFTSIK